VRELLRHRGLVAPSDLCEAREPGSNDESLPVRRQLLRELLEEARANRARADEAHVAHEHVPELRDLVELRRAQPPPQPRFLRTRSLHELLTEIRAEAALGAPA
jgi:hypothetical protein